MNFETVLFVTVAVACVSMLVFSLLIAQVNSADLGPRIPFFGRGWKWFMGTLRRHRSLFPTSAARIAFYALWSIWALLTAFALVGSIAAAARQ